MLCRALTFLVVVVAALIGWLVNSAIVTMAYDRELTFSDNARCRSLDAPTSCEDLTAYGEGLAIASCGDLLGLFANGSASAETPGAFFLVDPGKLTMTKIEATGPPLDVVHGLYYSKRSARLYVVHHNERAGESVEVYDVVEPAASALERLRHLGGFGAGPALELKHALTVRSPLFNNGALNDVVEGDGDEFYVTEWLPIAVPKGGKAGLASATLDERLSKEFLAPMQLAHVRMTKILRCTTAPAGPRCEVATDERFVMANGIATSDDRSTFFVADSVADTITRLRRAPDGTLVKVDAVQTPYTVDNMETGADGALYGGSVPLKYTCREVCSNAPDLAATKVVGGREVGCGRSPGGALRVSFEDGGAQTELVMHDGSMLSGVTAALKVGGAVVLGSAEARGVLVCEL